MLDRKVALNADRDAASLRKEKERADDKYERIQEQIDIRQVCLSSKIL